MPELIAILCAIVLIAATVYVHHRLPIHTQHARSTYWLQALLIGVGALAAYLGVLWTAGGSGVLRAAAAVCGFGVVHVPAFFILYIKRLRGEYDGG